LNTTWKITEADRDAAGNIKVDSVAPAEPRSLADLLPKPEEIRKDAQRITPQKMTRAELATLAVVALMAAFILMYAWATPNAPTAPPQAQVTALATAPAVVPTIAPTAAPAALVAYFDYRDPASVAPITANQITRVVGQAGDGWRLVDVGGARVWIAADQVPTGVPAADPLPDLAPRRPTAAPIAPTPVVQPVVAPAPPPVPCTQENATYRVHRQVLVGTMPIGEVNGWSCTSQAEAIAHADEQEAQVRAGR
jgi:hypothetical protein